MTAQTKSPAVWRGFRLLCCGASAVLAVLAALTGAILLLLLLTWLLAGLTTLLLSRLLARLIALLLLARGLVGILVLVHSRSFLPTLVVRAPHPNNELTSGGYVQFRTKPARCLGTVARCRKFPCHVQHQD